MIETKIASRYSKALFTEALEQKQLEQVYTDAIVILNTLDNSRDLFHILKSPIIRAEKKRIIVTEVFNQQISEITLNFIMLIINKRREFIIKDIFLLFIGSYKEHHNIITFNLTTAQKLTEEVKQKILHILEQQTNKTIDLNIKLNPDLIGGFVLNWYDKQLDASIRKKLQNLKKEFNIS